MKPLLLGALICIQSALLFPSARSATVVWQVDTDYWSDAAAWNSFQVPDSHSSVLIDGNPAVNAVVNLAGSADITALQISAGDRLLLSNSSTLTIAMSGSGSLINSGTIQLTSTAGSAVLLVATSGTSHSPLTINNTGGTILVSGTYSEFETGANTTLTGGRLLDSKGVLAFAGGVVSSTAISATNGMVVMASGTLQSTTVTLFNSKMGASSGSATTLKKVTLWGDPASVFTAGPALLTLSSVSFLGGISVNAPADTISVSGNLVNTGTFTLGTASTASQLFVSGMVSLSGSGTVLLRDQSVVSNTTAAPGTLVNADNIIRGSGVINGGGSYNLAFTNKRLTVAGSGDSMTIYAGPVAKLTNSGTLRATGGTLTVEASPGSVARGILANTNGLIESDSNSSIYLGPNLQITGGRMVANGGYLQIANSTVTGSLLSATNGYVTLTSGTIQTTPVSLWNSTLTLATSGSTILNNLSITGNPGSVVFMQAAPVSLNSVKFLGGVPVFQSSGLLAVSGVLTNTGTLTIGSSSSSELLINGPVTLTGSGTVVLENYCPVLGTSASATLTNQNNKIHGSFNTDLPITNQSVIEAGQSESILICSNTSAKLTNGGILRAVKGGYLTVQADYTFGARGILANTNGLIESDSNSSIYLGPNLQITGGRMVANGGYLQIANSTVTGSLLSATNGYVTLTSGTIQTTPVSLWNSTLTLATSGSTILNNLSITGNPGSVVFMQAAPVSLNSVKFLGGVPVFQSSGLLAVSGVLTNTGTLTIGSSSSSELLINGPVTLTGSGTVVLENYCPVLGTSASATLTNQNNKIHGSFNTDLPITNQSVIEAGQSESILICSNTSAKLTNGGILRAVKGGYLTVQADYTFGARGILANANGLIESDSNSVVIIGPAMQVSGGRMVANGGSVQIQNSTVAGSLLSATNGYVALTSGTLQTTPVSLWNSTLTLATSGSTTLSNLSITGNPGSVVFMQAAPVSLNSVKFLNGVPVFQSSGLLAISGMLTNTGTLTIGSSSSSELLINGPVTLSGSGKVALAGNSSILGTGATSALTNSDNKIHGTFNAYLPITNRSVIEAGLNESILIYSDSTAKLTNSGILRAVNGGILTIEAQSAGGSPGILANANGLIEAGSNGSIYLASMQVTGGRLVASGGAIQYFNSTVSGATISATNGGVYLTYGTLQSTPISLWNSTMAITGSNATLNNVTITGNPASSLIIDQRAITLNSVKFLGGLPVTQAARSLSISGGLVNTGTMSLYYAAEPMKVFINGAVTLSGSGTVVLGGNCSITGSASTPNTLTNSGNTIMGTGTIGGNLNLINAGTLLAAPGNALSISGTKGSIPPVLTNNKLISIQASGTNKGSIKVTGDFVQSASGSLAMQIGGVLSGSNYVLAFTPFAVSGNATLAGNFTFSLAAGVTMSVGQTLTIMTFASHTGNFGSYTGLTLSNGVSLLPYCTGTTFILSAYKSMGHALATATVVPAAQTTQSDPVEIRPAVESFQTTGQSGLAESFIDTSDAFTAPSLPLQITSPVPEPATGTLLLIALGILLATRKRSGRKPSFNKLTPAQPTKLGNTP